MFHVPYGSRNGLTYLLWRWIWRNDGEKMSWLDALYSGSSRLMNEYDSLAKSYKKSNIKPDKQYSILPTVLEMVGNCEGKTVIDIGCGAGFFTLPLAERGASLVCGIDNSAAQIELARKVSSHSRINYIVGDAFVQCCSKPADIITAPFVMNYARTTPILRHFFKLIHRSLKEGGKVVFVVDLPNGKSLKRFGATKTLLGPRTDETVMQIDLFNEERKICTLKAIYYTPETIEILLREVGFKTICWNKPIVSEEGIKAMGTDFWNGYTDDPELGYFTAEKN